MILDAKSPNEKIVLSCEAVLGDLTSSNKIEERFIPFNIAKIHQTYFDDSLQYI